MEEKDHALLDNYFNGLLDEAAMQAVRERAGQEKDFAQAFELRGHMERWVGEMPQRTAVRQTIEQAGDAFFRNQPMSVHRSSSGPGWRKWMAVAASVALLAAAWWFLLRPGDQDLYRQYAQHAPLQLVERSGPEALMSDAETAFNTQDYARALELLQQVPANNLTAQLYRGICLIETDRTANARAILDPMAAGASALRADAIWYIGLSYLREKNIPRCKMALKNLQPGDDHYAQAQALLRDL